MISMSQSSISTDMANRRNRYPIALRSVWLIGGTAITSFSDDIAIIMIAMSSEKEVIAVPP